MNNKKNQGQIKVIKNNIPIHPADLLNPLLRQSKNNLSKLLLENIDILKKHTQRRNYIRITAIQKSEYLEYILKEYPQINQPGPNLQQLFEKKHESIEKEIQQTNLKIFNKISNKYQIDRLIKQKKAKQFQSQANLVRQKLNSINKVIQMTVKQQNQKIQNSDSQSDEQDKIKQIKQFIKKIQAEKIERHKKYIEKLKREQQLKQKKLLEQKKKLEQEQQNRKQRILSKNKLSHQQREHDKEIRMKYHSQLLKLKKEIKQTPPLFQKLESNYYNKIKKEEIQQRQKLLTERRNKLGLSPIDIKKIQEHSKRYDQFLKNEKQKRKERQQLLRKSQILDIKFYSSYKQESNIEDDSEQEKQALKQKLIRIKNYENMVRQRFKPKIDPSKKKQLQNLLEEIELGKKKVKRIKLQNGSVLYEQLPQSDARILGIQNLEYIKKLTENRRKVIKPGELADNKKYMTQQKNKNEKINYLAQFKKNHERSIGKSLDSINKNSKNYDQKLQKAKSKFEIIDQQMKMKQKMLRYGKFETPQQILKFKEDLDQHYIDSIAAKLKLINQNK